MGLIPQVPGILYSRYVPVRMHVQNSPQRCFGTEHSMRTSGPCFALVA